jgi:hypothetical protein
VEAVDGGVNSHLYTWNLQTFEINPKEELICYHAHAWYFVQPKNAPKRNDLRSANGKLPVLVAAVAV